MPALNTPASSPVKAIYGRGRRAAATSAVLFAFLILVLSLVPRPGPASASADRASLAAPHLQGPVTATMQPGTGSVSGQAWIDSDVDGVLDAGEQWLAGMAVTAKNSSTGATVAATSGADGKYLLGNLIPGFYRVSAAPPATYELTTQGIYDVYVSAGATLALNFGARVPPTPTPSSTPPPLLDVESAEVLSCGGVYTGNTETGKNNVSTYGCRPWWDESGREKVYRLELTARQPVTVTLLNASADLDLFLLRYALPDSCLTAGDNFITYSADVGPYFLSVDGYQGASGGYMFRVDCPAEVQATATPTFTPSPTPTQTPTGTPAPMLTPTVTPTLQSKRVYLPLVLAPNLGPTPLPVTFVLQEGLNGYVGTVDTTLSSWEPTSPLGDDKLLRIFHARSAQIASQMETALRFDLSLVPPNASVEQAVLRLYVPSTPLYDIRARVAGLLRPWDEQTATWELAATGQPWAVPGAAGIGSDRTPWTSEAQQIAEGSRWYEFDLTPLVQEWSASPSNNHGMVVSALAGDSNASVEARFVSREGTSAWRPQLVISYRLTGAAGQQ